MKGVKETLKKLVDDIVEREEKIKKAKKEGKDFIHI